MTEKYSHHPLKDSRHIRLLKLLQNNSPSDVEECIECQLVQVSLDALPTYFAVSYAWESQTPTRFVLCEGKALWITANCAAALSFFHYQEVETFLWVDSICINQISLEERSQQVTIMGEIYERAINVLIWLGEGDARSDLDMKRLNELAALAAWSPDQVQARYQELQQSRYLEYSAGYHTDGVPRTVLFPESLTGFRNPTASITNRSWFNRIWTLQEIVLARHAVLICGSESISWDDLSSIGDIVTQGDASSGFTQYPGDEFHRLRVVNMLRGYLGIRTKQDQILYRLPDEHPFGPIEMSVAQTGDSRNIGIATHFFVATTLEGSEPRDKIYGLYAILQRYGIQLKKPDYEKSVSEIYRETAEAIIKHDSSLELLYYISTTRVLADLPSWVPDTLNGWFSWIPGFEFTTPSKDSTERFEFSSGGELSIFGVHVDTVAFVSSEIEIWGLYGPENIADEKAFFEGYRRVIQQFRVWIDFVLNRGYIFEDPLGAFCMVTLQEMALAFHADQRKWERLLGFFSSWITVIAPAVTQSTNHIPNTGHSDEDPNSHKIEEVVSEDDNYAEERRILLELAEVRANLTIHQIVSQRGNYNRLFATASGRLGIASAHLQQGDQVFLCSGMRLPMILRSEGGLYRLISAAWVHGVMSGELWPNSQDDLMKLTIV